MSLQIIRECEMELDLDMEAVAGQVVEQALDYVNCPYEVELNLTLTDNESIREMNREYRQIDKPTDVLSFPLVDYDTPADFSGIEADELDYFNPETGELMLGDIILSLEKVREQAQLYGHSEKREYAFLIAHSMLHLFGYDHMTGDEAKRMEAKQEEILHCLQIDKEERKE
ncbi:rRNA maturation RNase YbeY [Diplocloster hominis]|uniref:rRNA maturation RNase YbeY n=1 Tax=Diplocloster hominis TaxID=3079010 RepID=UPI0031BA87F0